MTFVRDKEILKEVIQAVEIWDLDVEKLTRITLSSIGKKINKLSLLEKNKGKLPKTMKYIKGVVEDVETFQIRRLHWLKNQMVNEGEEVVAWKLIRKAGLKDSITLKVKREISLLTGEEV